MSVNKRLWFLRFVQLCLLDATTDVFLIFQGYGLTGHCVVILLGTLIHTSHDHLFFYLLWAVFGGLSTLKMVTQCLWLDILRLCTSIKFY